MLTLGKFFRPSFLLDAGNREVFFLSVELVVFLHNRKVLASRVLVHHTAFDFQLFLLFSQVHGYILSLELFLNLHVQWFLV